MRTTLELDDRLVREAKRQALERGETLTRYIEDSLRLRLRTRPRTERFVFQPVVRSGTPVPGIDFEDRDALYEAMEGRR